MTLLCGNSDDFYYDVMQSGQHDYFPKRGHSGTVNSRMLGALAYGEVITTVDDTMTS